MTSKKHKKKKKKFQKARSAKSDALAAEAYRQPATEIVFEEEPTKEGAKFHEHLILLYGPPKIGKTTLLSCFDGIYFLPTEPGYKWLVCRKTYIPNWATFIKFVKWAESNPKKISSVKMFCVDTVDNLSKFAMQYACGREGIAHPTDREWGKGWEAFRDEFNHWILRLCSLPPGVSFVSHETERDVVYKSVTVTKSIPALPKTTYTTINNLVDIIIHLSFASKKQKKGKKSKDTSPTRCLYIRQEVTRDAGDRTGMLPDRIPFKTEKDAVRIINKSFE